MAEKLALRDYYGKAVTALAKDNENIVVLDADLSSSTKTGTFAKEYPERFFNVGISEQDLIGTAAGLAIGGKIPFASTFAVFASGRAWEQVRQSVAYPKVPVKIVATHGGITVGPDGPSHQATEDVGLMRALPNMNVIVPCDAHETAAVIKYAAETAEPFYVRLTREKFPVIYEEGMEFKLGKADELRAGSDVTFIACGLLVHTALDAAETLAAEGINARVLNMATIKPIDRAAVIAAAKETGAIVTVEDHSIINGLGSAVAEVTSDECPVPVVRIGIEDKFCSSGDAEELLECYGLSAASLVDGAKRAISKKNG